MDGREVWREPKIERVAWESSQAPPYHLLRILQGETSPSTQGSAKTYPLCQFALTPKVREG